LLYKSRQSQNEHAKVIPMQTADDLFRAFKVVGWCTTSFHAALVTMAGTVLEQIETPEGIHGSKDRVYEPVLMRTRGNWFSAYGPLPVMAIGMISGRTGWVEVPYVLFLAPGTHLAARAVSKTLPNRAKHIFFAGLTDQARKPFSEVTRGEENQILRLALARNATVVLLGTHSSWAYIRDGAIGSFQTSLTGEIFALLSQHSFIANTASAQTDTSDWALFDRGVGEALKEDTSAVAFLLLLFSARAGMLADRLGASKTHGYVSCVVISNKFCEVHPHCWFKSGDFIYIVGNDGLNFGYGKVAWAFDLKVQGSGEGAAIAGTIVSHRILRKEKSDAE
jgi:2-dehydro-3-deoxygalactonokinase